MYGYIIKAKVQTGVRFQQSSGRVSTMSSARFIANYYNIVITVLMCNING